VSRTVIPELATPAEAATELRTTTATVKRWLRSGELAGVRLPSGHWRVPLSELRALRTQRIHDHRRRDSGAETREPV
jgi:excisionase family DNA binding protein